MWKMCIKKVNTSSTWEEQITMYDNISGEHRLIPKKTKPYFAMEIAKGIIDNFNATLKEGESPRELIEVFKGEQNL